MALKALLTAATDCRDGTADPRALLPLFGRPLIEHQADRAIEAGVRQLLFIAPEATVRVAALVETLRGRGVDALVLPDIGAVEPLLSASDRLLVIGDGVLAAAEPMRRMADAHTLRVLLLIDDAGTDAFERVDINHRWAGLANVGVAEVRAVAALPSDWSPDSALMRQAMQHGAGTELLRASVLRGGELALPRDVGEVDALGGQLLAGFEDAPGDPADRYLVAPLADRIVRLTAGVRGGLHWLGLAGPGAAVVALGSAALGLLGPAGLLGTTALLLTAAARRIAPFHPRQTLLRHVGRATMLALLPILPLLGLMRPDKVAALPVIGGLLLLLLIVAVEAAARRRGRPPWMPGLTTVTLMLTAAALAGGWVQGVWLGCFLLAGALVGEVLQPEGVLRTKESRRNKD